MVARAKHAKLRRATEPNVQLQMEQLRADMQEQQAAMQAEIHDLQQQLTASVQQLAQAQQNETAATLAATETRRSEQANLQSDNAAVVSKLESAVTLLKGDTRVAVLQEEQKKTTAHIESPSAIHYKGVTFTPGGFIAAESVWRQHQLQADIASPFNSIPFDGTAMARMTEFRISARQSRMSLLAESPLAAARVFGYLEFDMLGAALTSNSNESNSYVPRLRHAWVQSVWPDGWSVAAGQMWTLAQSNRKGINSIAGNAYLPDMIEAQYVVGLNWLRQPSFRVVKNINERVWIAVAAEAAQTTFSVRNPPAGYVCASPGTTNLTNTVNYSFDKAPDIIAKVAFEPGFGHYELKGIARFFRDRVYPAAPVSADGAYNDNHVGEGIGAAASWTFAKKFDTSLNASFGHGIGRYGTSQLPDVTVRPDGKLAPVPGAQTLATLEYNPTPRFKIYAYGGGEYAGRTAFVNTNGAGVGYGSPLNDNTGCETEMAPASSTSPAAGKCAADTRALSQGVFGFWYRPYVGPMGRVQYGLQYSHTSRRTWSGIGGSPEADENMIFTSMRYYMP